MYTTNLARLFDPIRAPYGSLVFRMEMSSVNQSINELMVMISQTSKTSLGTIPPPILNTSRHLPMAAFLPLELVVCHPRMGRVYGSGDVSTSADSARD